MRLESEAKKLGIERIDLTVWSFNEGALNFYRSCGLDAQMAELLPENSHIFSKSIEYCRHCAIIKL